MNSMVATEAPEKPAAPSLLETWGKNERMRHIPSAEWMTWKLDSDLRRRVDKLFAPFATLPPDDPRHGPAEAELRGLCRAVERFADVVRHSRGSHAPQELGNRISWAIGQAVGALHSLDDSLFGRRYPFQTFERSKAESIWGTLLAVIDHVNRVTQLIRAIDPDIDSKLYENLVRLNEPMRETPMA
jgi:hypothetical protein